MMTKAEAKQIVADWLALSEGEKDQLGYIEGWFYESDAEAFRMAIKALEQEPKCGKWIAIDDTHSQCMECGAIFCITSSDEWEVNYCPNCGARMESDDE